MGYDKWQPRKRLTWYQIDHLKTLHRTQPELWNATKLAKDFGISIPAVSRILKSKFEPSEETKERQDAAAMEQTRKRREDFLKKLGTVKMMEGAEVNSSIDEQTSEGHSKGEQEVDMNDT